MVMYKVKDDFYYGTMSQIRELRQNGLLCDVNLTVGQDSLAAHRCVLASGSQYFRSLFLGQFKEASMHTFNLSDVTDSVKDLELVVNFMYIGEIDINESNLGVLVQLSSFLLIDALREFCTEYMVKHLCLRNCLRFYLYANVHSLTSVKEITGKMVKSRFHDYIIFDENLELSPDDVLYLMDDGIFLHCSALKMVNFVALWLNNEITEEHISVANQLLDKVAIGAVVPVAGGREAQQENLTRLTEVLHGQRGTGARLLREKAQTICTRALHQAETDDLHMASSFANNKAFMDQEEIVVTLSPTQYLVDHYHQNDDAPLLNEPFLDLCCYVPRTKTWYHIRDLKPCDIGYFKHSEFNGHMNLHQLFVEKIVTVMYKEELVMMDYYQQGAATIHFYNIRNKSNRSAEITIPADILLEGNEVLGDFGSSHCFVSDGHNLYFIDKVNVYNDAYDVVGDIFRCVQLEENGRTWKPVFRSDIERNGTTLESILHAKISSVSNEMIFTCVPDGESGNSYVFVVDLNEEHPVPVNVLTRFTECDDLMLKGVQITQTQSHFYIVQDATVNSLEEEVQIMYEYKFNSQSLTKPQRAVITINHLAMYHDLDYSLPCMGQLAGSSNKALWLFEGANTLASFLAEYETKSDGSVAATEHTPPPFHFMTAMFIGKLPADLLEDTTPIERFLLRDRKLDC